MKKPPNRFAVDPNRSRTLFYLALTIVAVIIPSITCNVVHGKALVFPQPKQKLVAQPGQKYLIFKFLVTNQAQFDVALIKLEVSCVCTQYKLSQDVLAPGQSGSIEIEVDLSNKVGEMEMSAALHSSEEIEPYVLRYNVVIPEFVAVGPRMLKWYVGDTPEERRFLVDFPANEKLEHKLQIKEIKVSGDKFRVRAEAIDGTTKYWVYVTPVDTIDKETATISVITEPQLDVADLEVLAYVRMRYIELD